MVGCWFKFFSLGVLGRGVWVYRRLGFDLPKPNMKCRVGLMTLGFRACVWGLGAFGATLHEEPCRLLGVNWVLTGYVGGI